jgi:hypothetical protein
VGVEVKKIIGGAEKFYTTLVRFYCRIKYSEFLGASWSMLPWEIVGIVPFGDDFITI